MCQQELRRACERDNFGNQSKYLGSIWFNSSLGEFEMKISKIDMDSFIPLSFTLIQTFYIFFYLFHFHTSFILFRPSRCLTMLCVNACFSLFFSSFFEMKVKVRGFLIFFSTPMHFQNLFFS